MLEAVGNVALGIHQQAAWQTDNPFICPTTSRRRQLGSSRRNVYADHGEITVVEFPNVGATGTAGAFRPIGVRVITDAAEKFNWRIHIAPTIGQEQKKCKNKIPAIAGLVFVPIRYISGCGIASRISKNVRTGHSSISQKGENDPRAAWRSGEPESQIHRRSGACRENHFS